MVQETYRDNDVNDNNRSRLSRLEAVVELLSTDVDRITKSISDLSERFSNSRGTNWSVVVASAVLAIAIVGAFSRAPLNDIEDNDRDIRAVEKILIKEIENRSIIQIKTDNNGETVKVLLEDIRKLRDEQSRLRERVGSLEAIKESIERNK